MAIFVKGLGLFVIGLLFIALGYYQHHLWQMIGIVFLGLAIIVAAWGYIGLFAARFHRLLTKQKPPTNLFDKE